MFRLGSLGVVIIAVLTAAAPRTALAAPPVSGLLAEARNGQVFLTWKEADLPAGTTFNVYLHGNPMAADNLDKARLVGHHIQPHSARNYWLDPTVWAPPRLVKDKVDPVGFIIEQGGKPLDPAGGLFVHTITAADPQPMYFTVVPENPKAVFPLVIVPGTNSLAEGVRGEPELPLPIWVRDDPGKKAPGKGSCKGRAVIIQLHGRGGTRHQAVRQQARYLVFGDASQGWIEGLAWAFNAHFGKDAVLINPLDGMWVGRPVKESPDGRDRCPGISTWWFGCNEFIYDASKMPGGRVMPYTENRLLYLVKWAVDYLGCDPDRVYIRGGSMGGSGTIAMALHHPEVFAAAYAEVPVVSCTHEKSPHASQTSAWRLHGLAGKNLDELKTDDGTPLLQKMNGVVQLAGLKAELPPLYLVNGRTDGSIPWINNPPFYRALDNSRQHYLAAWNNEGHGKAQRGVPQELQDAMGFLMRFRRDRSYPAFSNFSINENPGNGDHADGDIVGYMNYGLSFADVTETAASWSVMLSADDRGKGYPVTVDVTPRRLQMMKLTPGDKLTVKVDNDIRTITVDKDGLATVAGVTFRSKDPVKAVVTK